MKKIILMFGITLVSFNVFSDSGEKVYREVCSACHEQGAFGAPRLGVVSDWTSRISKGVSALNYNAIEGFAGSKGFMPPRGGNPDLSDVDVQRAVQYMIDKSW